MSDNGPSRSLIHHSGVMRVRKRPVEVKAIQWTGDNIEAVCAFLKGDYEYMSGQSDNFYILTLEGRHTANKGDWIIEGVHGEHYPCKPDIFEKTYEVLGS